MLERFKALVADYYNERADKSGGKTISAEDVYGIIPARAGSRQTARG